MILACTGHRPNKLGGFTIPNPIYNKICNQIKLFLEDKKPEKVLSGMALGFDFYVAAMAIKMKIPVIGVIPFKGQEVLWSDIDKKRYDFLLKNCKETIIVSEGGFSNSKMHIRNHYLVDNSDMLLVCWNGSVSGTKSCLDYALSKNKEINKDIFIINPNIL